MTRSSKIAHPDRVVQLNLQLIPLAGHHLHSLAD
jgi:hypothetical protein